MKISTQRKKAEDIKFIALDYEDIGKTLESQGKVDDALEYLKKSLKSFMNYYEMEPSSFYLNSINKLRSHMADLYKQQGKDEEAEEILKSTKED